VKIYNENAQIQIWHQKPLDGCVSSTGKPYNITVKKGTENKLLINFVGGGLSWNEETAARPVTIGALIKSKDFFYNSDISPIQLKLMHVGLLNAKDARNPFHNWNIVTIPYTSGDFHIGNNDFSFKNAKGESKVLYHHGDRNAASALTALKTIFPQTPDALVIAGQSAGGFGCVAHSPRISELYPGCDNIVVYSEVSHLHSPLWPEIAKNVWNVRPDLMEYIKSNDLIADLLRYAKDNMPPSTRFLHMASTSDKELVKMMHKMNHGKKTVNPESISKYQNTLTDVIGKLKAEIPNYFYYITDYGKNKKDGTTPHLFSGSPKLFYSKIQDGLSLSDWIVRGIKGEPMDIGGKFVKKREV